MGIRTNILVVLVLAALLPGCGQHAQHFVRQGMGPDPVLPEPDPGLLPVVQIAPAVGWAGHETPDAADGLAVNAFARGLDHPRWLYVLPNGDVLVAETNAPPKPDDVQDIKGWAMDLVKKRAGAAVPSADRISLLRDRDGDGVAEVRTTFLRDLHSPFGMALVDDTLYVANTDAVVAFPYRDGATAIDGAGRTIAELPAGPRNQHWTRSLLASDDGRRLYVGVGADSNIAENGMAAEENRAAVLEIDPASGATRVFASGLRNPVGIDWQPQSGALWVAVNERDGLGSDLVPDYMTSLRDGGFYGWPYSYFGDHVDERVQPPRPDLVERAIVPDYALGPHTSSLGLAFYDGELLPQFQHGALVGQHGSWNRRPLSGYKVIFVPFEQGEPAGPARDVLTGFVDDDGNARGRPVGVAVDARGAVLVADDVGNAIWRVMPAADAAME